MVWEEVIFLLFRPSPLKNPGVCTLHTFETKMAAHRKQGKCEQSIHIYLYFLTFDLSGAVWEPDAFDSVN